MMIQFYDKFLSDCSIVILYSPTPERKQIARSRRTKEKLQYIEGSKQRKVTLSRRKATLFRNAVKLHVMTTAEVLLIVEPSKEHRIVWGSPRLTAEYGKFKTNSGPGILQAQ